MVLKPNRFDKLFASGFHFPCLTLRPLSFKCVVKCGFLLHPQTKGQIKQRKNFWALRHRPRPFFFTRRLRPLFGYERHSWKARCATFWKWKAAYFVHPFFTCFYATLRLFTPLLRIFPSPCSCDFSKVRHFECSCRFFCLILESGMENCHFPKVDFKNTLAFQALPIFWSRTRGNGRSQANGSGWSKMLNFHGYSEMSKYCLVFQSPKVLWNVQVLSRISKS